MATPEETEAEKLQKRIDEADAEIETALKKILKKEQRLLTIDDKRFLQARRSYLTRSQQEDYEAVLKEKLPRPDGQPNPEEEVLLENMVRRDLEAMATRLGIEGAEDKKLFKTNNDLVEAIKAKQKENE